MLAKRVYTNFSKFERVHTIGDPCLLVRHCCELQPGEFTDVKEFVPFHSRFQKFKEWWLANIENTPLPNDLDEAVTLATEHFNEPEFIEIEPSKILPNQYDRKL